MEGAGGSDDCGPEGFVVANYDFYKLNDTVDDEVCSFSPSNIGARVEVDGACWQHSHPDEGSVYDFSRWAGHHPGNIDLLERYQRDPFNAVGEAGLSELVYPGWHDMERWELTVNDHLEYVGKLGDTADFSALPTVLQTIRMAASTGSFAEYEGIGFVSCGSRGEAANDPAMANRFDVSPSHPCTDNGLDQEGRRYGGKHMTWTTVVLGATDQLRQRVAWALSQIFSVGAKNFGYDADAEIWARYMDIFVANAFGNYRDIMQEVSMSPLMGRYLTLRGNSAFSYNGGSYPDENFARELMQLFTIGLWELNLDGTLNLDMATGERQETYTIDDIVSFARVWTGWSEAAPRGNIGVEEGGFGSTRNPKVYNNVDPMQLAAEKRDKFPKALLGGPTLGGHLGDGFPLCGQMAPRQFLRKGARYEYRGRESMLGFIYDNLDGQPNIREHFAPDAANSALYEALCERRTLSGGTQRCSFPVVVTLDTDLDCYGPTECGADLLRAVKIVDGDNVAFYTYAEPPCARLQFYRGNIGAYNGERVCADPTVASTVGSLCCHDPDLQLAEGPPCPATHPFYENNSGDEDKGDLCVHETGTWTCPRGCEALRPDLPLCVLPIPTSQPGIPLSGDNDDAATNLQVCTGDCDSDAQCATGLACFQRSNYETVPGCTGAGSRGADYCYDPALAVPCHLDLGGVASSGGGECKFVAEPVKYATASARCAAEYDGGIICPSNLADLG
jgi:hypothetical protein